jgi:hypothetical protein
MKTIKYRRGFSDPTSTLVGAPIWQLHGSTDKDVICIVEPVGQSWAVRLRRAGETMLNDTYADMHGALAGAQRLKDHLLRNGWTPVPIDEREMAVAILLSSLRDREAP